jgi:predicted DsbA family dithiol-disulfide isomerase
MEKAIHQLRNEFDFTISYSPFELNPDLPPEGVDQKNYLVKKFGDDEKYNQITAHITQVAHGEGLTFDFSSQKKSPNTRDAHRLLWLAKQEGVQSAVKEAFMRAYFEEGIDLTERSNLIDVATKAGLTPKRIDTMFDRAEGISEVIRSEELNYQRGISSVPFFVINNKYGVSGAQSTDFFTNNFRSIAAEPV